MTRQPLIALRLRKPGGIAMLVTSAILLAACAEPHRGTNATLPPPSAAFGSTDTDADGAVEMAEWNEAGSEVFASLDTDHGGSLSPAELEAGFDSFDHNRDGVIDTGEADIASLDTDGDGVISRTEWRGDIIQQNLDKDSDGSVSRAEYDAHRRQTFATQDRNGNGRIERTELAPDAKRFALFKF
jgi:hypothetical protein